MRTLTTLLIAASTVSGVAQTTLHQHLTAIASQAKGKVYVSCSLPGTKLDCDLDEHGITLPDGCRLALAVFVTNAHADQDTCEHVIAAIAQAIYSKARSKQP